MQRRHPRPALGVDAHENGSRQLDRVVAEDVPHRLTARSPDDSIPVTATHAAAVLDPSGIAHLSATAGVERRSVELDTSRKGVDDVGVVLDEVRLFVAEVDGHGSNLPRPDGDREPRWRLRRTARHEPHRNFIQQGTPPRRGGDRGDRRARRRGRHRRRVECRIQPGVRARTDRSCQSRRASPQRPKPPRPPPKAAPPMTEATADPNALVHMAETSLGTILVDQEGFTLYAFLNDTDGESTCTGDCLANWPAVVVEGELNVGNLDPAQFSTVENPEAGPMLKMGDWPLYRFAGDAAPGDINGQGVGEVWYVVGPLGVPASLVNTRETSAGPILVNAAGHDAVRLPQRHRGREHVHGRLPRQLAGCGRRGARHERPRPGVVEHRRESRSRGDAEDRRLAAVHVRPRCRPRRRQRPRRRRSLVRRRSRRHHHRGRHHRDRVPPPAAQQAPSRQAPRPPRPADSGGATTLRQQPKGARRTERSSWHPFVVLGGGGDLRPLADGQPSGHR